MLRIQEPFARILEKMRDLRVPKGKCFFIDSINSLFLCVWLREL